MLMMVALAVGPALGSAGRHYAPCRKMIDCSYNGLCREGECVCKAGWSGVYCHQLDLKPARNTSGLNLLRQWGEYGLTAPISTWGGTVIYDNQTALYHMYASVMLQSCGIHRWTTNSAIMHATSRGPEDEWKFVPEITQNRSEIEPIFPIFSHEPAVVRTPEDTLALFFTYYPNGTAADCPTCNCSDGNSYSGGSECSIECGCGENKTLYSYFSTAPGPYGPWSKPVSLCAVQTSDEGNGTCHKEAGRIDTNLSPVIFPSGELLAWTRWDIWTSDVWSDPRHYRNTGEAPDFSKGVPWEGEDPSMWVDSLGIFHILSHNGERGQNFSKNESHDCGRHFFSNTGKAGSWRVAPLLPKEDLGGCAYPRTVEFHTPEGLKYYTFYRRERPHLIFGPHGEAIALSSSVIDAPTGPSSPGWKPGSEQRDASYTLVQPLNVLNLHEVNVGYDADVSIVQL